jgi:hypothetical protein
MPAVLALGIAAAGEFGHGPLKLGEPAHGKPLRVGRCKADANRGGLRWRVTIWPRRKRKRPSKRLGSAWSSTTPLRYGPTTIGALLGSQGRHRRAAGD